MKIKWLAHAAFLITADDGTRIITDPYETSQGLRYGEINEAADIVTVSHEHGDHNNVKAIKGNPPVVKTDAEVKGIKIRAVATAHDDKSGGERGQNTIFCFEIDGIKLCHAGDLGHVLSDAQVAAIGAVDVLMVPVGGFFTIDASAATRVCDQLKPKVIIPMHFKTEKLTLPIQDAEGFLKGKANVTRAAGSEIELTRNTLPASPQIIVLQPSL